MSRFLPLDDNFSVSAQLSPADVQAAVDAGFKHIVCNRPDDEDAGQPTFAYISELAVKRGLSVHHIPFDNTTLTPAVIDSMQQTLATLDGPVLAYCRSGTRCSVAWSAVQLRNGQDMPSIESATTAAGYDLSQQRDLIAALAQN